MSWIDVIVIVPVIMGAFWGWRNGLIRWAITSIGAVVGIIVAGRTYDNFSSSFNFVDSESLRSVLSYAVVFLFFLVIAWIFARIAKSFLNVLLLGWVDNLAGLALGAFVGLMAASAVISLLGSLPSPILQENLEQAVLLEPLIQSTAFVRVLLPVEFDEIVKVFEQAKEVIPRP